MLQEKPRPVMQDYEYERARQELEAFYGGPDGDASVLTAKRDQAFAKLFYQSGWTREKLAEREGRGHAWVGYRLCFARFLDYATSSTTVELVTITEGRFRGLWEQTQKGDEGGRFTEVIRMLQEPAAAKPKPQPESKPEPKTEAPAPEPEVKAAPAEPAKPKTKRATIQLDKACDFIRARMDAGLPYPRTLHKEAGVSHVTYETAQYMVELERRQPTEAAAKPPPQPEPEPEPVNIPPEPHLSPAHKEKWETLESRLREKLEAELAKRKKRLDEIFDLAVEDGIKARIDEFVLPYYKERLEKADLLTKHGKPFTKQEFTGILLWALHSDTSSPENRTRAFILLKERELLLRPEEKEKPISGGLRYTMADLMAMRKKVMEQNREKAKARAAKKAAKAKEEVS